jgi:hypothetical protein
MEKGNNDLTRRVRLLRQPRWRVLRARGSPGVWRFLAGVRVWRQQDSDADALVVLVHDWEKQGVREMCYVKVKEEVQMRDQEGVEVYQEPAVSSDSSGGTAISG